MKVKNLFFRFTPLIFTLIALPVFLVAPIAQAKQKALPTSGSDTVSLGVTHMLPGVYVIPSGRVILGTSVGVGLFNFMELSTNLWLDLQQVFNASAKISLFSNNDLGLAVWGTYTNQTVQTYTSAGNTTNTTLTSLTPGFTFSYRLLDTIVTHFGASMAIQNPTVTKASLSQRTGLIQGNVLYHEYGLRMTDVLSLAPGVTYDTTYDIWGLGATLHVGSFQAGAHYYFNVSTGAFLPLIGGSYTMEY